MPKYKFPKGNKPINGFKRGYTPWNKGKKCPELGIVHIGQTPWNKGTKGVMKAWNKGLNWKERQGENHPRWIKDRSLLKKKDERNDSAYRAWVREVKKRDGRKCRIDDHNCSGYCIVHHILPWRDYPELRYKLNNGITLCQVHHPRKRAEEKRLIPFFQELVPVSKELI